MKSIISIFIPICTLPSFSVINGRNHSAIPTEYDGKQSAKAISDCAKCFEETIATTANIERDSDFGIVEFGHINGANESLDTL